VHGASSHAGDSCRGFCFQVMLTVTSVWRVGEKRWAAEFWLAGVL